MTFIIGTTIFGMFFWLELANAQISNSSSSKDDYLPIIISTDHSDVTTDFKTWNSRPAQHHHRQLRVVHGVINIFGWGILLPIGVIIARYCKRLPLKCEEWYSIHVQSKVGGFILGTIGWGLGISIRNSTKDHQHTMMMSTHGIIGTIIFTFTTIQVLAICLQPDEENVYRKYWVIYHNIFGYTLIILTIVNIFQGIEKEEGSHDRWKWSYVVLVSVMGFIALILEFIPCFNMIKNKLSM